MSVHTSVRAPRGTDLSCLAWPQEAAYRMLHNNLDPEVAERPEDLVVYGGTGKAARDWASFDAIARTLRTLKDDETLLVQSGRPVGVLQTHEWAPRVLLANSNLVGEWANWEEFRRLEALGLTMYGQMTAGSWIYIGSQGILQGTYETFAAVGAKRFGGSLEGTITLTAGLGGMGGAQPLAVTMAGGVAICVEVDPARIARRIAHGYLDAHAVDLEDALQRATEARDARRPLSIGVLGNAAEAVPELLAMGAPIDIVTDQTSAHDPLAYLPAGVAFDEWRALAESDPAGFTLRARESMARHVEAMVGFMDAGAEVFDYGNSIRAEAQLGGYDRAFAFPGFVPAYIRPLFCEGRGPFRWAALSGDPADIARDRPRRARPVPGERGARALDPDGRREGALRGPARPDLLARPRRAPPRRAALQRDGRQRRAEGAGRDRPRPPRLRLGRLPLPRDGGDARRLGRDRRLAAAQRARQHRLGRDLGVAAPRRRRRHRALDPRGPGHRRRRHPAGRGQARAGADQRPRDGDRAPRRRRLRARGGGREGPRRPHPDAGGRRLTRYWAEHAWLGGDRAEAGVLIDVEGERIAAVGPDSRPDGATVLPGLTLPGLANAHSHAFHRALRGRTHRGGGTFWTWREDMYAVAERLDPDAYRALARAVFGEMALAGITCVGEFHYLHHGDAPYAEPNAMGEALIAAAADAGIRITLLDTCYLAGGFDDGARRRPETLLRRGRARLGRARRGAPGRAARPDRRRDPLRARGPRRPARHRRGVGRERGAPLHAHLSEQRAENDACLAAHGRTPAELLEEHGALGSGSCMVHATHLTDLDVRRLGGTAVCLCATTERDLADGIGPARALADAGAPLCTGSDSHAVIDPFEEARAIELDERLRTERRGHFGAAELLRAAANHAVLGWPDAGRIEPGALADLVTVGLDSVRLAGAEPDTLLESVVFAGAAADVREVVASGRHVVADGRHATIDVAAELRDAIAAVLPEPVRR